MSTSLQEDVLLEDETNVYNQKLNYLILHNDEVNTFDYVIETLVDVCKHDFVQAEQCVMITHYKGVCDVKKGSFRELKYIKDEIVERGLKATID